MSTKMRIFKKNVHFYVFLYAHFEEKCVTLRRFFAIIDLGNKICVK